MVVKICNNVILPCGNYAISSDKDDKVEMRYNVILNLSLPVKGIGKRLKLWLLRFLLKEELKFCRSQTKTEDYVAIKINQG